MSKFLDTKREVNTNVGESQAFSIQASAKAFKVLIDGLYANKPVSITRELWANAFDAHIAAGKTDVPFEVLVPSRWDPRFFIRDFGISMTHDQIMNMYSTVFQSTKTDDSSAVGAFGLGSKSPFSYTDTFTVTAYLGGKVRQYAAVVNGEGIPTINFLGEDSTKEKDGIAVSFPIAAQDVDTFVEAQKQVSLGHTAKPITADGTVFKGYTVIRTGEGWTTFKPKGWNEVGLSDGIYARMGCVIYPVDINAVPSLKTNNLQYENVIFDFNINEVAVTASREALSYGRSEPTEKAIVSKVEQYVQQLIVGMKKDFDAEKTLWDKRLLSQELRRGMRNGGVAKEALTQLNQATFGRKDGNIILSDQYVTEYKDTQVVDIHGVTVKNKNVPFRELAVSYRYQNIWATKKTYTYPKSSDSVSPEKSLTVVIQDMSETEQRRTGYRISLLEVNSVIWIRTYKVKGMKKLLDKTLAALEGATIITADKLPEIPKDAITGRTMSVYTPTMATVARYEKGVMVEYSKRKVTADEAKKGGYIIPTYRGKLVDAPHGATDDMRRLIGEAQSFGFIPPTGTVIVVPATLNKRFSGGQWENLVTKLSKAKIDTALVTTALDKAKLTSVSTVIYRAKALAETMKKPSKLQSRLDSLVVMTQAEKDEYAKAQMLYQTIKREMPVRVSTMTTADTQEIIMKGYPMVELLLEMRKIPLSSIDIVADYVYTMDTNAKT